MKATGTTDLANEIAQSYTAWLLDAGADLVVGDSSISWLEHEKPSKINDSSPTPRTAEVEHSSNTAKPEPTPPRAPNEIAKPSDNLLASDKWATDLDMLRAQIQAGEALPGAGYGGSPLLPIGETTARYMLIFDLPDVGDVQNGTLLHGAAGALIGNMMKAAGISSDDQFVTALSLTRPATGDLPEGDTRMLSEFMRLQIAMVEPEYLILFGSSVSTALLGAELMEARGNLHYFNHNDQNVAALTTFHPRTLLARPQLKAQAWRDLLVLQ